MNWKYFFLMLSSVFVISTVQAEFFIRVPGLFDNWREFYKAREISSFSSNIVCRHSAFYFWVLTGKRGSIIHCNVAFSDYDHAMVSLDGRIYDPYNDRIYSSLPGEFTVYEEISSIKDIPVDYLKFE